MKKKNKVNVTNLSVALVAFLIVGVGLLAKTLLTSYAISETSTAPDKLVTSTGDVLSDRVSLFDDLTEDEMISLVPFYGTDTAGNKYNVYCLEKDKDWASNQTITRIEAPLDDGYAYIIKNGYPTKSLTGNNRNDEYLTQIAVWFYQDRKNGVTDATNGVLTAKQKTAIKNSSYYTTINKLIEGALNAKGSTPLSNPTFSVSSGVFETTSDNNYLISNVMRVTSNAESFSSYYPVATGTGIRASAIEILDENNNVISNGASIDKSTGFKIRIPLSEITSLTTINVEIVNNYREYVAYSYAPPAEMTNTMQKSYAALLATNPKQKTITTSLDIPLGSITINKVDGSTNQNLEGANFSIIRLATKETIDNFTTGSTAHKTINLLPGEYQVIENSTKVGYYITNKTTNVVITSSNLDQTKTIVNDQLGLSIRKIDSVTKKPVSGAVLKIVNSTNQTVKTITTTNDYVKINDLAEGKYKVVEVTAPDGYIVSTEEKEFTLNATNPSVTLDFADEQNETVIVKKDAKTNEILAGAVLKIINKATGATVDTFTTTTTGHSIKGLSAGTYKVVEESAPAGYVKSNEEVEFTITTNQKEKQTITFYNTTNQISISKVDEETGAILSGAKINILDSSNAVIKTFTTTSSPYLLDKLANGTYYLQEVEAPNGYTLNSTKQAFTVTDATTNLQLTLKNKKNTLKVGKIDADTKEYVAGATLRITNSNGDKVKEFVSESNLTEVRGLSNGKYYIEEIKAPAGYIKSKTKKEITITDATSEITTTLENKKIKVTLNKVAVDTGKALDGVMFELLDSSKARLTTFKTTTSKTVISDLVKLTTGTYYLREISTKDGYVLDDTLHEFSISEDDYEFTVTLKNKPITVMLGKIDAKTKKYIKGATLRVSKVANSAKSISATADATEITFVSDSTPTEIKGLTAGAYVLEEIKAPTGYVGSNSKIYFEVTNKGTVETYLIANDVLSLTTTNKILTIYGENGYKFAVYKTDGTLVTNLAISNDKSVSKELPDGDYYLKEIEAPAGVTLNTNLIYFSIGDTLTDTIRFTNDFTKVYISKKDITNSEEVEGATLTLTNSKNEVLKEWTSTKNPYYIEKLPVGIYQLKEIIAPSGYILNTSIVSFEVKDTGEIQTATMYNSKPIEDVPNTSKNSKIFYVFGTIFIIIGGAIVAVYYKNKGKI